MTRIDEREDLITIPKVLQESRYRGHFSSLQTSNAKSINPVQSPVPRLFETNELFVLEVP